MRYLLLSLVASAVSLHPPWVCSQNFNYIYRMNSILYFKFTILDAVSPWSSPTSPGWALCSEAAPSPTASSQWNTRGRGPLVFVRMVRVLCEYNHRVVETLRTWFKIFLSRCNTKSSQNGTEKCKKKEKYKPCNWQFCRLVRHVQLQMRRDGHRRAMGAHYRWAHLWRVFCTFYPLWLRITSILAASCISGDLKNWRVRAGMFHENKKWANWINCPNCVSIILPLFLCTSISSLACFFSKT